MTDTTARSPTESQYDLATYITVRLTAQEYTNMLRHHDIITLDMG